MNRFPLGFWNYTSLDRIGEAQVEEWADCGLTLPMGPAFSDTPPDRARMRQILTWAHERRLRLLLCDPRVKVLRNPGYADRVAAALRDFGDHPALFGLEVCDEPGAALWEAAADACRIVRTVAAGLPTTVRGIEPFVNQPSWYEGIEEELGCEYEYYLDRFIKRSGVRLLCFDCYEQMLPGDRGLPTYWRNLEIYRKTSSWHGLPFWATILSTGHRHYRCPSEDDIRWQVSTALAYGAQGILYFMFYTHDPIENYRLGPIDAYGERTPRYYALKRTNRDLLDRWGDLLPHLTSRSVTHWPLAPVPGVTCSWRPTEILRAIEGDGKHLVVGRFSDRQQRPYLMVVNASLRESARLHLAFPGGPTRVFGRTGSGTEREVALTREREHRSWCEQWLAPGQMELWRVSVRPSRFAEAPRPAASTAAPPRMKRAQPSGLPAPLFLPDEQVLEVVMPDAAGNLYASFPQSSGSHEWHPWEALLGPDGARTRAGGAPVAARLPGSHTVWLFFVDAPSRHVIALRRFAARGVRWWAPPRILHGTLDGGLAAAGASDGRVLLAALGTDRRVYLKRLSGTGEEEDWEDLGGTVTGDLALLGGGDRPWYLLARGTDGVLYARRQVPAGPAWEAWSVFGGQDVPGKLVTHVDRDRRAWLFVRGGDGVLWACALQEDGAWSDWECVCDESAFASHPAITEGPDGSMRVFVRGYDHAVYTTAYDSRGPRWSSWHSLGGRLSSDPTAARDQQGSLHLAARGTDGLVYHRRQAPHGEGWDEWKVLGEDRRCF